MVGVNETAADGSRTVTLDGRTHEIPVTAGRARLVLFERGSGRVLAVTPGRPIP